MTRKQKIEVVDEELQEAPAKPTDGDDQASASSAPGDVPGIAPGEANDNGQDSAAADPQAQLAELNDKYLRAIAEQKNIQRRAAAERTELLRYASASLMREMLGVIDDLDRMLEAADKESANTGAGDSALAEGVRLIRQKFMKSLTDHHVTPIDAVGHPFDPTAHEALAQQPSAEHEPSTVIQEYQPGYRLWDRVLRPAKVIVSSADAASDAAAQE